MTISNFWHILVLISVVSTWRSARSQWYIWNSSFWSEASYFWDSDWTWKCMFH